MKKLYLISIFLVVAFCKIQAVFSDFSFRLQSLTVNNGLVQHDVSSIVQDKYGFVWFATYDGLMRYDGYSFRIFRNVYNNNTSISDNRILNVFSDKAKRLWITTEGGGINLYNYQTESFQRLLLSKTAPDNNIYSVFEDGESNLWVGVQGGIHVVRFDSVENQPKVIKSFSGIFPNQQVISLLINNRKDIFLGTTAGLYKMTYKPHSNLDYDMPVKLGAFSKPVYCVTKLDSYNSFVGDVDGLFLLNHTTNQAIPLKYKEKALQKCRAIVSVNADTYIVGTEDNGIFELRVKPDFSLNPITVDRVNYFQKCQLKALYVDKYKNLWIGTGNNGVGRVDLNAPRFFRLLDSKDDSGEFVRYLYIDKLNRLWVQLKTDRFFLFTNNKRNYIPLSNNIKVYSIAEDAQNNLWACSGSELFFIKNGTIAPKPVINTANFPNSIRTKLKTLRSVQVDSFGTVWVGTINGLLMLRNVNTPKPVVKFYNNFKTPNNNLSVHKMYIDNTGKNLWICSRDFGLFCLEPDRNGNIQNVQHFDNSLASAERLNSNHVWSVLRTNNGDVWVGTDLGLNKIALNKGKYKISSVDALQNFKIQSIIEADNNRLWLNTSNGLLCYNPSKGDFRKYTLADGLTNTAVTECSQADINGVVYISTINGITYFKPGEIAQNPNKPKVCITQLQIFNKEIRVGDTINNRVLLTQSLLENHKISLKYNENNFSLQFVGLHFANSKRIEYLYKLDGYSKDWIPTNAENRTAVFNNLPAGVYKFMVKASNGDGVWSEEEYLAEIEILPAPWLTWWAWIIYMLFLSGVTYIIWSYYTRQEKLKRSLWQELMEHEHDKELNETRLRFHTNITHEIRTPITLITAPLHEIMERKIDDEFLQSRIKLIYSNTQRLSRLVNQFLDLRKIDRESMSLKVSEVQIPDFLKQIIDGFEHILSQKSIDLSCNVNVNVSSVYLDEEKLNKIITNLLSNAVKFTSNGGKISLDVFYVQNLIVFKVTDNGIGIDKSEIDRIFERFYQSKHNQSGGTGIGLALVQELVNIHRGTINVESVQGASTSFTVSLPASKQDYKIEELAEPVVEDETEENDSDLYESDKQLILVVEDDDDMRDYLNLILSPVFEVILCHSAVPGIEAAGSKIPDLIITDWMMPEMSGIEFCQHLKADFRTSHIPVVILTGKSSQKDVTVGYGAGAEAFITKPFVPEQLILQVKNMIKYRRVNIGANSSENIEIPVIDKINERERKFINKLDKCLEEHLDSIDFGIEDICKEVGTSRMQLHRKLIAILGISTSEYIRNYKMKRAKEFLESGEYNISEVVYQIGFKSNSHFTKVYKSTYGVLPSDEKR